MFCVAQELLSNNIPLPKASSIDKLISISMDDAKSITVLYILVSIFSKIDGTRLKSRNFRGYRYDNTVENRFSADLLTLNLHYTDLSYSLYRVLII